MSQARFRASGLSAVNEYIGVSDFDRQIEQIKFHLSSAAAVATAATTFTVSQYTSAASPYNVLIFSQPMVSVSDWLWNDGPVTIPKGSDLNFSWVNDASSYKAWGLEVLYNLV